MASQKKHLMVRVIARDAQTMRALLGEHVLLDMSCGGPHATVDGRVVLTAQMGADAVARLQRPGIEIDVLYDVEARARKLAKQIGKGNRFLGKVRYPQGLGRLVAGNRDVDVP